jgi:hypothetical protein
MRGVVALHMGDLVRPAQRVIDAAHDEGDRIRGIERLVRIHLAGLVRIRRHLPAGQVDGLEPGLDLLDCLIAGERAQRRHEILRLQQLPQPLSAAFRQRVMDAEGTGEARDLLRAVVAADPGKPASGRIGIAGQAIRFPQDHGVSHYCCPPNLGTVNN